MNETDRQVLMLERFVETGEGIYGMEWGDPQVKQWITNGVLDGVVRPNVKRASAILEIGSGGGRWSQFLMDPKKKTILVDGTPASEKAIRRALTVPKKTTFLVSKDGKMPTVKDNSIDFIFSWDTFVHFHEELFFAYLEECGRILRPGGTCAIHFVSTENPSPPTMRYHSSDAVIAKARHAGLATVDLHNFCNIHSLVIFSKEA